jgi:hypothetical protein
LFRDLKILFVFGNNILKKFQDDNFWDKPIWIISESFLFIIALRLRLGERRCS